jgi:RNA polymerase sigma-70 factor (ECF subfamily)
MTTGMTTTPTATSEKFDIVFLIDEHSAMLYRFCRSLAYSKEDAEDLFQETWLSAIRKPDKILSAGNPQNFLYSITLFIWKSQQRKYARRKRLLSNTHISEYSDTGYNPEDEYLRQEEKEFVRNLVSKFSDKFRIPLILYYNLELDITTIGKVLELPTGTVKSRLYTARQEIKKELLKIEHNQT